VRLGCRGAAQGTVIFVRFLSYGPERGIFEYLRWMSADPEPAHLLALQRALSVRLQSLLCSTNGLAWGQLELAMAAALVRQLSVTLACRIALRWPRSPLSGRVC